MPQPNKQSQFEADLRDLMNLAGGRRVMMNILNHSDLLRTTYTLGDAQHSAFCEGRRSMGLWLMEQIEMAAPGSLARLLNERLGDEHA